MTRIAAIDQHSGYVWGEVTVSDELDVCAAAVAILSMSDRSVDWAAAECSQRDLEASLHLYEIPAALVIENGQDQATIDAVSAGTYLGTVRTWDRAAEDC